MNWCWNRFKLNYWISNNVSQEKSIVLFPFEQIVQINRMKKNQKKKIIKPKIDLRKHKNCYDKKSYDFYKISHLHASNIINIFIMTIIFF